MNKHTIGQQFHVLVTYLFEGGASEAHWLISTAPYPHEAGFYLGHMAGEASKVALGACRAFMIRPSRDWWAWSINAMDFVCDAHGLIVHMTEDGEIWGLRAYWLPQLHLALAAPYNSPLWHRLRGRLCGVPGNAIDPAYHERSGYRERCEVAHKAQDL